MVVEWLDGLRNEEGREESRVVLEAAIDVIKEVAATVLEKRGHRAVHDLFGITREGSN